MSCSIRMEDIIPEDCPLGKYSCLYCDHFGTVINDKYIECCYEEKSNAKLAVEMTRKEEREKAIKKFREVTCKMGVDISCDNCSSTCVIYKFKELLDKQ